MRALLSLTLRQLLRATLWTAGIVLLATVVAIALAVQTSPRWAPPSQVSAADVARARDFLRRSDPRRLPAGNAHTLVASEQEVNLLADQLVARVAPGGAARLTLSRGSALLQASLPLPRSPAGGWLNVEATLQQTSGLPRVEALRIGRLPVPRWVAERLLSRLVAQLGASAEGQLAHDMVQRVGITPGRLELVYAWRDDSYQRLLGTLVPPADQARLKAYAEHLADLTQAAPAEGLSLAQLLPPLFELARQRSAGGDGKSGDALAENRALLLTLAVHVSGRGLATLVPAARHWRQPRPVRVTLAGRDDFPQHLLISAVLALEGGGPLADAIGVYKEVADARHGSGFSFNDIAADRAGTRLGLLARRAPEQLQAQLARGIRESDFMPDVADLPQFLSEADFLSAYGGVGAPAYRRMQADIERRLDALPLFRGPLG
ncbi:MULTISPECIES: hypothetical protein [unclassified Roseateles]|uniref:hypothetical protein n=1 Tax=unclassified Roseateles TaxID=2626991 RepID=UPI0006F439F6|nr:MULTISPECIES: hypothetical protein [unclassified Roseateles]KQW45550.1 hypothetical protein ASC81_11645 [Pelomonas sp. Root405]KRA72394.1 hypothetical protein ASD88_11645 [Pelomonas sp. Root662]